MKRTPVLAAVIAAGALAIAGCGGGSADCVDAPADVVERVRETLKPGYQIDGLKHRVPTRQGELGVTHVAGPVTGMDATAVWATNIIDSPNEEGIIISVGAVTEEVSRMGSTPRFPITDSLAQDALACW